MTGDRAARPAAHYPRLLYVGDVPVESSYHGAALLYRLLCRYPPGRLLILESGAQVSVAQRRLDGVGYRRLPVGRSRWLNSRFHALASTWLSLTAARAARRIPAVLNDFAPEAVLTVGHGYGWLSAARYAGARALPLHLIMHDDWPRAVRLAAPARRWLDGRFGQVYRQAVSRLCVSPCMAAAYARRYRADGAVLYPSRATDLPEPAAPRSSRDPAAPLVYAFGGSINSRGYLEALRALADALERHGGCLNLYGPLTEEQARQAGLSGGPIRIRGLLPAGAFVQELREQADVLFLPMSFAAEDQDNMRLCFPSKLTDYTATDLPLLIYGPRDCAAVRWAGDQALRVAEVVTRRGSGGFDAALERLRDPAWRRQLGAAARGAGNRYFSQAAAEQQLLDTLRAAAPGPVAASPGAG